MNTETLISVYGIPVGAIILCALGWVAWKLGVRTAPKTTPAITITAPGATPTTLDKPTKPVKQYKAVGFDLTQSPPAFMDKELVTASPGMGQLFRYGNGNSRVYFGNKTAEGFVAVNPYVGTNDIESLKKQLKDAEGEKDSTTHYWDIKQLLFSITDNMSIDQGFLQKYWPLLVFIGIICFIGFMMVANKTGT